MEGVFRSFQMSVALIALVVITSCSGGSQKNLLESESLGFVTPDGWASYQEGQEYMLFLFYAAALTGVRTTVGLNQGAFALTDNSIVNGVDNLDLFENVLVSSEQLTDEEVEMLQSKKGAVDAQTFIAFVDKAVQQGWFNE